MSRATVAIWAGHLKKWILPAFGKRSLEPGSFTPGDIQTWLLTEPRANQTGNHILFSFRRVCHQAQMDGLLGSNPAGLVAVFGRNPDRPDPFTLADFALLFPEVLAVCIAIWGDFKHYAALLK